VRNVYYSTITARMVLIVPYLLETLLSFSL
jgi:hypothetical protein